MTTATITCPECGASSRETMPTNACQFFYTCPSCSARLRPKDGDCCVFCSYSDQTCPPKQAGQPSC
ncbi:MAG TPA: GDCCVxC domain-containing (seleno)protein [Gaiellaceae bacterium]